MSITESTSKQSQDAGGATLDSQAKIPENDKQRALDERPHPTGEGKSEQTAESTSASSRLGPAPQVPDDRPLHERIHEAFYSVAFGSTCTLPVLLAETRRLGISDEEVHETISKDETTMATHCDTNRPYLQCFRNRQGVCFLETTEGGFGKLASINELFQDLNETNTETHSSGVAL